MLRKFRNFVRKGVGAILPEKSIEDYLSVEIQMSDIMKDSIERWTRMYEDIELVRDYEGLNLGASIASELARLTTIEMESKITGLTSEAGSEIESPRAEYLDRQYQKVIDKLRVQMEYACAKGGIILKPYVDNNNIAVDYVQADCFYPTKFNSNGDLVGVIFPEIIVRNKETFTRLEYHELLENGDYYISNSSFVKDSNRNGLGVPIQLESIGEWAGLETEVNIAGLHDTLFAYIKMPLANHKDSTSQLGVSVYGKAENLIDRADMHWAKIMWEYEGTELAIDAGVDMLLGNEYLPKGKERLFRMLDAEEDGFYKVFSPQIRDASLFNGLNKILQKIEFSCGLAYGTLSDIQVVEKTAEEIKASKQRSYSMIVDIQKQLQVGLEHLVFAMDFLTDLYSLAPAGDYEVSYHFDDSIIIDTKSEQAITMQEVASGLIKPELYLMKRYGVTEEQAREMLPKVVEDTGDSDYDDLE